MQRPQTTRLRGYPLEEGKETRVSKEVRSIPSGSEDGRNNVQRTLSYGTLISNEPLYTERYVRWCERTLNKLKIHLLLDTLH